MNLSLKFLTSDKDFGVGFGFSYGHIQVYHKQWCNEILMNFMKIFGICNFQYCESPDSYVISVLCVTYFNIFDIWCRLSTLAL